MEFRFVILGAANIASKFCKAVKLVPDCEVAAVASKSLEKAQRFAEAQDIFVELIDILEYHFHLNPF